MPMQSDTELLASYVQKEDDQAYAELVARHSAMVFSVCRRVLGDSGDAEDAAQATFIVLMRKWRSIRSDHDLSSWLYSVAKRAALMALRKRLKQTAVANEMVEEKAGAFVPDDVCPEETEKSELVLSHVDAEVAALPQRQKQAILLRYVEGRDIKTSADLAGCTVATMKSRTNKGIENLRRRLSRRGIAVSASALAGWLGMEAHASVPETLVPSIMAASKIGAAGAASGAVGMNVANELAKGVMRVMYWTKFGRMTVAGVMGLAVGLGVVATRNAAVAEETVPPAEYTLVSTIAYLNQVVGWFTGTEQMALSGAMDMTGPVNLVSTLERVSTVVDVIEGEYPPADVIPVGWAPSTSVLMKWAQWCEDTLKMRCDHWLVNVADSATRPSLLTVHARMDGIEEGMAMTAELVPQVRTTLNAVWAKLDAVQAKIDLLSAPISSPALDNPDWAPNTRDLNNVATEFYNRVVLISSQE